MSRVEAYVTGLSPEEFRRDIKTQDAIIPNIEVIGEAVKNLSPRLRKAWPHIPWRDMAGARDKLIHHYFGINYEIIWIIASEELRALKPEIEKVISTLRREK